MENSSEVGESQADEEAEARRPTPGVYDFRLTPFSTRLTVPKPSAPCMSAWKVNSRPVRSASSYKLTRGFSMGRLGSDQETTRPICSNLAETLLLALGSLGRQDCIQEILYRLQTWVALRPHRSGYHELFCIAT